MTHILQQAVYKGKRKKGDDHRQQNELQTTGSALSGFGFRETGIVELGQAQEIFCCYRVAALQQCKFQSLASKARGDSVRKIQWP
eukprot:1015973-Pelagomonas_calceolata.AAC.1